MRFATITFAAALAASSAYAQTSPLASLTSLLGKLSPTCQGTVLQLVSPTAPLYTCLQVSALGPVILSNSSILPSLDTYLSDVCDSVPCTNQTLGSVATSILTDCASDLASRGISNQTVYSIFELYPLAREVACLKTSMPFNGTNATIPISASTYNQTNGTFCLTSVLTSLSAYTGTNVTTSFVGSLLGSNTTAKSLVRMLPPSALCSDCVFAGIDLVYQEYPQAGNLSYTSNMTVNSYFNGMCNATGYNLTSNGTLPKSISETAVNTTYPFNVTAGNMTFQAGVGSVPPPAIFNQTIISQLSSAIATATASASASSNVTTQ